MDSPWDENPSSGFSADAEWAKISNEFTNASIVFIKYLILRVKCSLQTGYREGITAGKESALQEGFDDGFARVGAPLGRELGILRGVASAILSFLSMQTPETPDQEAALAEAREINTQLGNIRFTDIAPRDLEAEEHARQHLEEDGEEMEVAEEIVEKRKMEKLEEMMDKLTPGSSNGQALSGRPTIENVKALQDRLGRLTQTLAYDISVN